MLQAQAASHQSTRALTMSSICCPICGEPVLIPAGHGPDVAISAHIERGCVATGASCISAVPPPAGALGAHRCCFQGCRRQELRPRVCPCCRQNFCTAHSRSHCCDAGDNGADNKAEDNATTGTRPSKRRRAAAATAATAAPAGSRDTGARSDNATTGGAAMPQSAATAHTDHPASAHDCSPRRPDQAGCRSRRHSPLTITASPPRPPHPQLLIIDLDQTLWPFDAARPQYGFPHRASRGAVDVVHCVGTTAAPFREAVAIVRRARDRGWKVGVASANPRRDVCESLLHHLDLLGKGAARDGGRGCVEPEHVEIYPGSKTRHLERLAASSEVAPRDMLFFDDRAQNIRTAQHLGVTAVLVDPRWGLTEAAFAQGCARWQEQRSASSAMVQWLQAAA